MNTKEKELTKTKLKRSVKLRAEEFVFGSVGKSEDDYRVLVFLTDENEKDFVVQIDEEQVGVMAKAFLMYSMKKELGLDLLNAEGHGGVQ